MVALDPVDLRALEVSGDGVAWSAAPVGVNVNLVVLGPAGAIGEHRNDEVDVLLVVIEGDVVVDVDGDAVMLGTGHAAVVPAGTTRAIAAGASGARYLTVHRARTMTLRAGRRRRA